MRKQSEKENKNALTVKANSNGLLNNGHINTFISFGSPHTHPETSTTTLNERILALHLPQSSRSRPSTRSCIAAYIHSRRSRDPSVFERGLMRTLREAEESGIIDVPMRADCRGCKAGRDRGNAPGTRFSRNRTCMCRTRGSGQSGRTDGLR